MELHRDRGIRGFLLRDCISDKPHEDSSQKDNLPTVEMRSPRFTFYH
jgi:hypothetical protein